jgi:hypothetical protein
MAGDEHNLRQSRIGRLHFKPYPGLIVGIDVGRNRGDDPAKYQDARECERFHQ